MTQFERSLEGGCHCSNVRFVVSYDEGKTARECNCSICTKSGQIHFVVEKEQLEIKGFENLSLYQFNTKVARHYFCKTCGIKPFHVPRSHPNSYSVNLRCIDDFEVEKMESYGIELAPRFDGKNWEKARGVKSET